MEQVETAESVHWTTPLAISVICFLVSGAIHILIGVLTPIFVNSKFGRSMIFISKRTDTRLFETDPSLLLEKNKELARFRTLLLTNAGGSLVIIGIFIIAVTWFGLRNREMWAFLTLSATGVVVLPYWYFIFKPYLDARIRIGFSDLPPIFWIPTLVLVPGIVFGWLALRA